MARVQQQGVNAVTIWMIIFVVLWLTATVFLVVLYTGQEDMQRQLSAAQSAKNRAISNQEESSLELVRQAREGGPTAVGLIDAARGLTAELATGNGEDAPGTVREKRDGILSQIRGDALVERPNRYANASLFDALDTLYGEYRTNHALLEEAQQRREELETRVSELTRINAEQKDELDAQAEQLAQRIHEIEADRTAYRTSRNEQIAGLQTEFGERSAQADADLTRERQRRAALAEQYEDLQERFGQLQEKLGLSQMKPEALTTARVADGKVLMAVPGDPVVYIDLGREDQLTLGMEFAVYSGETGIPEDGRSKARIEVVSISPSSAECKIVALHGNEVILEGDLIANPIYDPTRPLTFMVLGVFDLNRDGTLDPGGAAGMRALVADWGGVLTDDLNAQTDFVVLGAAPPRPRTAGDLSPDEQEVNERVQAQFERYVTTLEAANSLGVPVLTQDVFLRFLGYGGGARGR